MRNLFVGAGIALAFVGTAAADTLDVLRENTLILHEQSGRSYNILIGQGSQLEQVNSAGVWAAGFWSTDAEKGFCWTARGAATLCIPMPMDKQVGDTWEIRGPVGQLVWTAEIREGRADLRALNAGNSGQ
jgi:hypothetical protein